MLSSFSNRVFKNLFSLRFVQLGKGSESIALHRVAKRRGWVTKCVYLGDISVNQELPFHHILYVKDSANSCSPTDIGQVAEVIQYHKPPIFFLSISDLSMKDLEPLMNIDYSIVHLPKGNKHYVVGFLQHEDRYRFQWPSHLLVWKDDISKIPKMYMKGYFSQQKKYKAFRHFGWEKALSFDASLEDEEQNAFYIFREILQAGAMNLYSSGIQISLFQS